MKKNILLTGSHRSGSTWAGNVIAQANNVRYIHEPFNINGTHRQTPFIYWFEYLDENLDPAREKLIKRYLASFYSPTNIDNLKKLSTLKSPRAIYQYLKDLKNRVLKRTLVKDPIAVMSAEWLFHNLNWDVVVLIRHPAAFIASLKVKDWQFNFNDFLKQPELMNSYLNEYLDQINDYAINKKDIISQGILLWNIIHSVIWQYQQKYSDKWYFVRHEDLSRQPVNEFEQMFRFLNLEFSSSVRDYINQSTTSSKPTDLTRDSKENIKSWKKRLTTEEVKDIKQGTEEIWKHFYTDQDW